MSRSETLVLIPHYNNLDGLYRSLESIGRGEKVDILVVDDGSASDQKPDETVLKKRFPHLPKIVCLDHAQNRGIEHALNDGLRYAAEHGYPYVARLDAGDLCHPGRFATQRKFLDEHPDVALVGSWVRFVNQEGRTVFPFKPPTGHQGLAKAIYLNNPFCHPAVMFRTEALERTGLYPLDFPAAEDYAFFFEFVERFQTANIPEFLLDCELNPEGISLQKRKKQIASRLKVIMRHFDYSPIAFYGLLRNTLIYLLPYRLIESMKKWIRK